jgi:hypothetical protein
MQITGAEGGRFACSTTCSTWRTWRRFTLFPSPLLLYPSLPPPYSLSSSLSCSYLCLQQSLLILLSAAISAEIAVYSNLCLQQSLLRLLSAAICFLQ